MSDCVFCRIASGEIPAKVVKRSPEAVAFHDLNPQAPVHVLIIPVVHHDAARDVAGADGERMLGHLLRFACEVATELGLDPAGYRLVLNTGANGGQTVLHLHLHLLGGRRLGWPPG